MNVFYDIRGKIDCQSTYRLNCKESVKILPQNRDIHGMLARESGFCRRNRLKVNEKPSPSVSFSSEVRFVGRFGISFLKTHGARALMEKSKSVTRVKLPFGNVSR